MAERDGAVTPPSWLQERSPSCLPATQTSWLQEAVEATFDQWPGGLALVNLEGRLIQVNAAYARMLGCTEGELRGVSFADITHPEDREHGSFAIRQMLAGERRSCEFERRYVSKQGAVVPALLQTCLVRDRRGKALYFASEVRPGEEAAPLGLWNSERHRRAVDLALDPIGICNADLRYLHVNEALCQLYGRKRESLLGCPFHAFLLSDEITPWRESIRHLTATGVFRRSARLLLLDGRHIPVGVSATQVDDYLFQLYIRDVSRWHDALRAALDEQSS